MRVGYHFHVPAVFTAGSARVPAHYALFVRALADSAGELTFYAFSTPGDGTETELLDQANIRCVDLGARPGNDGVVVFGHRWFGRSFRPANDGLDGMIVRCPTPLLTVMVAKCERAGVPVLPMLVDDMRKWNPTRQMGAARALLTRSVVNTAYRRVRTIVRTRPTAAISQAIYEGNEVFAGNAVFTSTFNDEDLAQFGGPRESWPDGLGTTTPVRLLFTGRFAEQKGLFELVDALRLLHDSGRSAALEMVGYSSGDPALDGMLARAEELGVRDAVTVTGFVAAGPELLAVYRRNHLYVLPTHGEGSVPRTVKEAMATRTPVITTSIPHNREYLTHGVEALLVEPFNAKAVADAVIESLADEDAARARADRAFLWASSLTTEASAARVLAVLASLSDR